MVALVNWNNIPAHRKVDSMSKTHEFHFELLSLWSRRLLQVKPLLEKVYQPKSKIFWIKLFNPPLYNSHYTKHWNFQLELLDLHLSETKISRTELTSKSQVLNPFFFVKLSQKSDDFGFHKKLKQIFIDKNHLCESLASH